MKKFNKFPLTVFGGVLPHLSSFSSNSGPCVGNNNYVSCKHYMRI